MAQATKAKGTTFGKYLFRFCRRFGKDASPWARDNIIWGIAVLVIPPIVALIRNRTATPDWTTIKLTLWLYGVALVIYLIGHCVRTPWKIDQEREVDVVELEGERDAADHALAKALAGPQISGHFYQFQIFPRTGIADPDFINQALNVVHGRHALDKSQPHKCDYDVFVEMYLQNDSPGKGSIIEYIFEMEFEDHFVRLEREFNFNGWIIEREESQMNAREFLKIVQKRVQKPVPSLAESAAGNLEQGKGVEGWLHYVLRDIAYTEFDGIKKRDMRLTINDGKGGSHIINKAWTGEPRPWRIGHDYSV
jgi:hypothetical protein